MPRIRLLIVDDHEMVREGIKLMLSHYPDIEIIGEVGTASAALKESTATHPDVMLLDLQLPDGSGLDVLAKLQNVSQSPAVLILTVHDDPDLVLGAARAGARGYVLKHTSHEELADAVRIVARGDHFFGPEVVGALVESRRQTDEQPLLTTREREVLRLLVAGCTNREIGERLFLSPDTVKTHLGSIYRKLEVDGRTQAAVVALRSRLLE